MHTLVMTYCFFVFRWCLADKTRNEWGRVCALVIRGMDRNMVANFFQQSFYSNLRLRWFCFTTLFDWSTTLTWISKLIWGKVSTFADSFLVWPTTFNSPGNTGSHIKYLKKSSLAWWNTHSYYRSDDLLLPCLQEMHKNYSVKLCPCNKKVNDKIYPTWIN